MVALRGHKQSSAVLDLLMSPMWTAETSPSDWLNIRNLAPERVLDALDGPRLFAIRNEKGQLFLAYQCGEDATIERFLLVPANERLLSDIVADRVTLRDALTSQSWAWLVDRDRNGHCTTSSVNVDSLPEEALPSVGVHLNPVREPILRVRMIGRALEPGRVPSSVVRRAIDGATGAVRTLIRHVLDVQTGTGRPADWLRRYYDLPAVSFAFRSFEIAFGQPESTGQPELGEAQTLAEVQRLLRSGLEWASADAPAELPHTVESTVIVNALNKLAPPQQGVIERVEVSGHLAGAMSLPISLGRLSAERIAYARRHLLEDRRMKQFEGFVREFDKDKLTFWLRQSDGMPIQQMRFVEEQFDDVWAAFESNQHVSVSAFEVRGQSIAELVSLVLLSTPAKQTD